MAVQTLEWSDDSAIGSPIIVDATRPVRRVAPPTVVRLGYRVQLARTVAQLREACAIRAAAFGKRQPELARMLLEPEQADLLEGTMVVIAYRESDGVPVGTMRLQTNLYQPLEFETHIELPPEYDGRLLAVAARLAVVADVDTPQVSRLLMKALHAVCTAQQVARVLITAQAPRDRLYRAFGFREVWDGRLFRTASTPHYGCKLMAFDMFAPPQDLMDRRNLEFLRTPSPDIGLFTSMEGAWLRPRNERAERAGGTGLRGLLPPGVLAS